MTGRCGWTGYTRYSREDALTAAQADGNDARSIYWCDDGCHQWHYRGEADQ